MKSDWDRTKNFDIIIFNDAPKTNLDNIKDKDSAFERTFLEVLNKHVPLKTEILTYNLI